MSKQLYEKVNGEYVPISPNVDLEKIIDSATEQSLVSILLQCNHFYVEFNTSVKITRNKVPYVVRRKGLWVTYHNGVELVTERYIGDNRDINEAWSADYNWKRIVITDAE